MLGGLRSAFFLVPDLTAARSWYVGVLGFSPYFDEPFYVGFDVQGYELGLQPTADGEVAGTGGSSAAWHVRDVPAAMQRFVEAGATVQEEARDVGGGITYGAVQDPWANSIGLIDNPHFAPPITQAQAGDLGDRQITCSATVAMSPSEAFDKWATGEGLASWWVADNRVELRPGGHYELYFLPEESASAGGRGSEGCRVLSFLPGKMLSFTWNAPPHLPATRERYTWVVLTFDAVDGGTEVTLTHTGWPASEWDEEPQWAQTFAYFEAAWARVMALFAS